MLIELIKKQMPECDVKLENNLIFIFKEGKVTHYDYNYLNYLYQSGQLTEDNLKFNLLLMSKLP